MGRATEGDHGVMNIVIAAALIWLVSDAVVFWLMWTSLKEDELEWSSGDTAAFILLCLMGPCSGLTGLKRRAMGKL